MMATILSTLALAPSHASASILKDTVWDKVSKEASCNIPAELLYAVAIVESRYASGRSSIRPHAFALRNRPSGSVYPSSLQEAESILDRYIAEDRLTDIGAMQINLRWNGHRVDHPSQLLDLKTNVAVGAEILCESLKAYPEDITLGIGGYHTRNPERRNAALQYGQQVLHIWRNIGEIRQ